MSSRRIAAVDIPLDGDDATGEATIEDTSLQYVRSNSYVTMEEEMMIIQPNPEKIPIMLSFRNLKYSVKVGRNWKKLAGTVTRDKVLLNDISGDAKDGEIMAVLGPSGSGKSTLLDALANRISEGSLKGEVTLNGEKLESSLLKIVSAYVMQDDVLYPMLTVEETLLFAAKLRLPRSLSDSKKKKRVEALIEQLGLKDAAHTVIGDEGHRGVSGGERRRVSIGIGIVHDPIILFLDEPTSGLDSTSAYMVVNVLKRIAQSGSIVVMSVHQPSYRIVSLLDRLLVLSRGETIYNGSPSNLPLYMENFGLPVPEEANPIEYALDIVRDMEGSTKGTLDMVEFNKSSAYSCTLDEKPSYGFSLKAAISASIFRGKLVSNGATTVVNERKTMNMIPSFANPLWIEVAVLVKRSFVNSGRMPESAVVRYGIVALTAIILATLFWHVDDSPKGIHERVSFFAIAISTGYYSCGDAVPVFLQERLIFMRETAYNTYRRSSYAISHALAVVPTLMLQSLIFSCITFLAVGLEGGISGFTLYFFVIFASFWTGTSFVTLVSGVIPHLLLCYVAVVATISYFFLASGFYIVRTRISPYWIWFHYISLLKYSYEAMMQNEFHGSGICYTRGVQIFDNTLMSQFPAATKEKLLGTFGGVLGMNLTTDTCLATSDDILKDLGITKLSLWDCLWLTFAWGVLFRIMFYISLLVGSKNKRN